MKKIIEYPILMTSLFSGLLLSCQNKTEKENKPNIIYILADDLGRAELGCYGQEIIETPYIT